MRWQQTIVEQVSFKFQANSSNAIDRLQLGWKAIPGVKCNHKGAQV